MTGFSSQFSSNQYTQNGISQDSQMDSNSSDSQSRNGRKRPFNQVDLDREEGEDNTNGDDIDYRATPTPFSQGVLPSQSQRIFDEMSSTIHNTQSYGRNNSLPGGTILKIHVTNFMCHKNLEINLGPRINFIVGHNGSGKSAILTALSVCLGGKVSNTDRGKSLKELIRRGQSRATVSVRIQNTGIEAYQHELYGDIIEIVRSFSIDGSQGYRLKSESGKIISQKKEELISILDRFQILIDNPLAILSQDAARSFLTSSTPSSLYHFLAQGINHEAMKKTIQKIASSSGETVNGLEPLRKEFEIKKRELDKLKKEFDERKSVREIAKNKSLLEIKIQWKIVESKRELVKQAETELNNHLKKLAEKSLQFEQSNVARDLLVEKIENCKAEFQESQKLYNERSNDYHKLKKEIEELHISSLDISKQIDEISRSMRQISKAKATLETKIKQEEVNINGGFEETQRQNVAKKDELESRLVKVQNFIQEANDKISTLEETTEKLVTDLGPLKSRKTDLEQEIQEIHHSITLVQSANNDFMNVFPRPMLNVLELIGRNSKKFTREPLGPIGKYITLKDPKWASILARQFRISLNAFVVVDPEDRIILQKIMDRVNYHSAIIVSRPDMYEYEHTMPDREKYKVLLDILDISDEHIKRVMIDQHKVESVILAPSRDDAERIMYHEQPKNASACYCLTGPTVGAVVGGGVRGSSSITPIHGLKPPFFMRTESVEQAETLQNDMRELGKDLSMVDREIKEMEIEIRQKKKESQECERQCGKYRDERRQLNENIDALVQELAAEIDFSRIGSLKEQLILEEQRLHTQKSQLQSAHKAKEEYDVDLLDATGIERKAKSEVVAQENAMTEAERNVMKANNELVMFERDKYTIEEKIAAMKQKQQEMEEHLNRLVEEANESQRSAERTGTKQMKVNETMKKLTESHRELMIKLNTAEQNYGSRTFEDVSRDVVKAAEDLKKAKKQFVAVHTTNGNIREMLVHREKRYEQILRYTTSRICQEFQHILKQRDFEGQLDIDHDHQVMTIMCAPKAKGGSLAQRDTRSLSGGEKSFSQIALLLSVWSVMSCNIRGLDEFDVFMDEVNRKVSMKLMIKGISEMKNGQTIFITPNNMADINVNKNDVKIFRLSDPER